MRVVSVSDYMPFRTTDCIFVNVLRGGSGPAYDIAIRTSNSPVAKSFLINKPTSLLFALFFSLSRSKNDVF